MYAYWEWVIGGVLVIMHAHGRFNTPSSNRSSTTILRYYFAFTSYLLSLGFLFVVLGGVLQDSPQMFPDLLNLIAPGDFSLPDELKRLPGPLLSALVLTTLLPNFPALSKFDEWLRKVFQEMGNIPWEVRRFSARLRRSEYQVPSNLQRKLSDMLPGLAPISPAICCVPNDSLQSTWIKINALYLLLKDWSEKKRYDRLIESLSPEYKAIEKMFTRAKDKASNCFQLQDTISGDESALHALEECKRNFKERMDELFKQICDLIARGVLTCEFTKAERNSTVAKMGFTALREENEPLSVNQVVTLGMVIFLALLVGILVIGNLVGKPAQAGSTPGFALSIAAMVAIIYGLSIVASIYPKTTWAFANVNDAGQRPVPAYLLSGCIAMALGFLVSLSFKVLFHLNVMEAIADMKLSYPWLAMSFAVAFVTAFLADDFAKTGSGRIPRWLRWAEGGVEAIVLVACALMVHIWIAGIPGAAPPPLWGLLPISGVIGFVIGFYVPHWYRSSPLKVRGEEDAMMIPVSV